ncbi:hypothetical protein [Bacillus sp. T33-2]|uniref:hypothetical protein n=1 Tax=Bacillus sp. T33-2 TaxID=2054168 RepID=UPI000C77CD8B|nr:hypothetical protein [Bacillus sp. T33-2]PLR93231.1 hypothetical protein CVD19_19705 [Bacillus sp. T33-2]
MDRKTLEYMEERATKARGIVNRIERLLDQVEQVKRARGVMDLYTRHKTIRLEMKYNELAENNYTTEVVAAINNAFVNVTLAEIRHLEQELAEL